MQQQQQKQLQCQEQQQQQQQEQHVAAKYKSLETRKNLEFFHVAT